MARPIKDGLDYFSIDVDFFSDIKIRRIKKECGAASLAVLLYLLCSIYRDGYYIGWNEDVCFLVAETFGTSEGSVQQSVNVAVKVGFFDKTMFENYGILTSNGIQKRYIEAKRGKEIKSEFRVNSEITQVIATETIVNSAETPVNVAISTQSKVKESKEKERKGEYICESQDDSPHTHTKSNRFNPPSISEIKTYCKERNNKIDSEYFFDYYVARGWKLKGNEIMKDWKATIRTWERNDLSKQDQKTKPDYTDTSRYENITADV